MRRFIAHAATLAALAAVGLMAPGTAMAVSVWDEEAAMSNASNRSTFIADPGPGLLWSRAGLIAQHAEYYRARGFGNVLLWGEQHDSFDPGGARQWAGCETLTGVQISPPTPCADAPSGLADWTQVSTALADTRIHAFVNHGAFIARVCGNFSRELTPPTDAPSISGAKFEDLDADGNRDPGEPGIENWTIRLYNAGDHLATTTTDGDGNYHFELDANTYRITSEIFEVHEVLQPGWEQSVEPDDIRVPYGSGNTDFGGNDFGNFRPATISGRKFRDVAVDGSGAGDVGLEGWQIAVKLADGTPVDATTTAADGSYSFTGVRPGRSYVVSEAVQPGWRQSAPSEGGTHPVGPLSGDAFTDRDFGNVCLGAVEALVTESHSGATLAGVRLRLEEIAVPGVLANVPVLPRETTSGRFGDLLPGEYRLTIFLPAGYYTADPALQRVDGNWALVKRVTVNECLAAQVVAPLLESFFLIIDEDSIDNGSEPNRFTASAVNDDIAELGVRRELRYFDANEGREIALETGQVGDEGWFAPKTIPASWASAGPTASGLSNFILAGPGLGSASSTGDREALLDKVPNVTPLRATGLKQLVGKAACAVVYDSDVSINYGPLNGSLKGANLGIVGVEILSVVRRSNGSSSSLPIVTMRILDADEICHVPLKLHTGAPAPRSSSSPFDVRP